MTAFTTTRILRFGDCDPAGIAYFPSYFHFLNGVHEEWWQSIGFPWRDMFQNRRIGLPTVQLDTHKSIAWPEDILAALRSFQESSDHV